MSKEADALLKLAGHEIICFKCDPKADEGRITVIGGVHSAACRLARAVKAMVEECAHNSRYDLIEAGHEAAFPEEK